MAVPFLDLARVNSTLNHEFQSAFQQILASSSFIMGADVAAFESEFAAWVGARHAIGVSSGTDALLATLMALDIGPGDEVLVPTLTFFATAGTVARLGATPVFVDVDPNTMLMDVSQAMDRRTDKTKAIIPVHLFGQCVPMESSAMDGLVVIEDCAQAHGATNAAGQNAGIQGDIACFSFFPTKPLGGFGDGGMVTTNDDELAQKVRLMRVHGAQPKFHHLHVGGNFRLDTLQAALLRLKLPTVDAQAEDRRAIASMYRELLSPLVESGELRWVARAPGTHVYHQLCARVTARDALRDDLKRKGIGTGVYYPEPLHTQPCFAHLQSDKHLCPHAELACAELIALPCFSGLTEGEVREVAHAVMAYYESK